MAKRAKGKSGGADLDTLRARQLAARERRSANIRTRLDWFAGQLEKGVRVNMRRRIHFAAQLLRDQIVVNLSLPVVKRRGRAGRIVVDPTSRSKPGEFPRADTTRLMKDIFFDPREEGASTRAIVGTTLNYGLILETRMHRSFLLRTLRENEAVLRRILVSDGQQLRIIS